jgi:hypothetical protein
LRENLINQLGYPPLRIDILTSIDGISFKSAYPQKKVIMIDDFTANYIGLIDLIHNKNASGRQQDLVDVQTLEISKKNNPS